MVKGDAMKKLCVAAILPLMLLSGSVFAAPLSGLGAFQAEGQILINILVLTFVSMIGIVILKTIGYGQVAGLITFIAVCIVLIWTVQLFNSLLRTVETLIRGV
jgi:ABC-type multidrug transport system permease subunit